MQFNTLTYAYFFAAVFTVSWLLRRFPFARLLLLLGASYYFYAYWDPRFLVLLFGSSTVDYYLAHWIARTEDTARRKFILLGTVVLNLGLLGFFKYFNFAATSVQLLSSSLGYALPKMTMAIALPIGISFFTFESMSYVVDVYRRELEPHESYLEYLLFVSFFPHLVAGPIVRPRDLLPQLSRPARFRVDEASEGLFLIAVGLLKKIAIGDYLGLNLVDRVFDAPLQYSALEVYAGVLGYALQVYCDFSGYTDIAIGSALLLGVRFPQNFDSPYQSSSITEFWRRWHISLSTWLRDYLYIPLGGNRKGAARTYVNLVLTMMLGGLWHGASFTFLAWGTLHGGYLAIERFAKAKGLGLPKTLPTGVTRALQILVTFHLVAFAWIFFRSETFGKAALVLSRLGTWTTYHPNLPWRLVAVLGSGFLFHAVPNSLFERVKRLFISSSGVAQGLALGAVLILLRKLASTEAVPFVYFQF